MSKVREVTTKCLTAKYIISFLLLIILLLLAYYFTVISKTDTENSGTDTEIHEEPKLTSAEVQEERRKLAQTSFKSASSSPVILKASSTEESKVNPKINRVSNDGEHQINFSSQETGGASDADSMVRVSSKKNSDGTTVAVYETEENDITINRVEKDQNKAKVHRVVEGVILQMNSEHSEVTVDLKNDIKVAVLHLDESTKVTINGKTMDPADLRVRDEIRAEGSGIAGAGDIETSSLEVVGFLKIGVPGG